MNNIIEWHKKRWKERRVKIGCLLWIGSGIIVFGVDLNNYYKLLGVAFCHFFGMYLVFRYYLFANEVDNG